MIVKRIFAGSIVAILLAVFSLAGACDLSCAFASMKADCHAQGTKASNSQRENVMDGMAMSGMTMAEMGGGDTLNHPEISAPTRTIPAHAAVVDMGTCERQSCDQAPVLAAKSKLPVAANYNEAGVLTASQNIASLQTASHDARDDLARIVFNPHDPVSVSLRV